MTQEEAQQLCLRLVSRPGVLQEASEALTAIQIEESTATGQHKYDFESAVSRHPIVCCRYGGQIFSSPPFPTSFSVQSRESRGAPCPSHKTIQHSTAYIMRASLLPIIRKAIEITFTASSGGGGFSLSSGLRIINTVRRSSSPAFALFDSTYSFRTRRNVKKRTQTSVYRREGEDVLWFNWEWDHVGISAHLKYIIIELQRLFSSGQASASDQDENGRTLLHVSSPAYLPSTELR